MMQLAHAFNGRLLRTLFVHSIHTNELLIRMSICQCVPAIQSHKWAAVRADELMMVTSFILLSMA